MVRISKQQENLLAQLKGKKELYNRALDQLDVEFRLRREELKRGLAREVISTLETGIPARQVALKGLGYADVGSLKQFTDMESTATAGTRFSVSVEQENTGPITLAVTDDSNGLWEARRGDTKIVAFHVNDPIPWEKGTTHIVYPREFADIAERDEIFALLKEQYPDLEWDE